MVVHMWRQTDERKVWYEWMVDVYAPAQPSRDTTGQGKGKGHAEQRQGTKVKIGGSELHSSIKEACLM
jgi:protein arginine N-methyltransferase 5